MAYAASETISSELLELASSKIDELTFNRIKEIGFDNLTTFQKEKIVAATLLQAKYFDDYGTEAGAMSSFSLPGISMSFNGTSEIPAGVSQGAYTLLKQTVLMSRRCELW